MATGDSSLGSCVIVVGDLSREFVQTTLRLAREWEVDVELRGNVYAAVAAAAQAAGRRILVVGEMEELASQNCVFFRIAAAHALRCCCWLSRSDPTADRAPGSAPAHAGPRPGLSRGGTRHLLTALRAGVTLVGDAQDIRDVLQEWIGRRGSVAAAPAFAPEKPTPKGKVAGALFPRGAADVLSEDLRATEAELRALLG